MRGRTRSRLRGSGRPYVSRRKAWIVSFCLALAAAFGAPPGPVRAAPAPQFICSGNQITLFDDTNGNAVVNGATSPRFTTDGKAYCLTYIQTYHWNDGNGAAPGTLGLTRAAGPAPQGVAGEAGPFAAKASAGQNNAPNVNWYVDVGLSPPVVLDGTYACTDSDPSTWSTNGQGGPGFCIVYAVPALPACSLPAGAANPTARPCADLSITDWLSTPVGDWGTVGAVLAKGKHLGARQLAKLLKAAPRTVVGVDSWIMESVTITNNGDDPGACSFRLDAGPVYACANGPIAPGQVVQYWWWWRVTAVGRYRRSAQIVGETVPDPVPGNNGSVTSVQAFGVAVIPRVKPTRRGISGTATAIPGQSAAAGPPPFTGTVDGMKELNVPATGRFPRTSGPSAAGERLARVEVAVLRLGPHNRVAPYAVEGPSCDWLTGPGGAFATAPSLDGVCLIRSWLRARGTARWSFRLREGLPPGRYLLFVRTVDRAGLVSSDFSAADHTRVEFRVT